jgi:hypothetical protein
METQHDIAVAYEAAQPTQIEHRHSAQELSVQDVVAQVTKIQQVMRTLMHEGEHYGFLPGTTRRCNDCNATGLVNGQPCKTCGGKGFLGKASLYQPGAQKIMLMFRLIPEREVEVIEVGNGHREVRVRTVLRNPDGEYRGEGRGVCSTMESKYRYRNAGIGCPECGKETIRKSKPEYGGGWYCDKKKGGCGMKWPMDNNPFDNIVVGRIEYEDPADYWNTVTKMSCKRADVHAAICATAASDIFTQDLEDLLENQPDSWEEPSNENTPIQPPRRMPEPPKEHGLETAPPQSEADMQAELANYCGAIAQAGKIVTSRNDFKSSLCLAEVGEDVDIDALPFQICAALGAFYDPKKKQAVMGNSDPSQLTGAALKSALAKAKKVWDSLEG